MHCLYYLTVTQLSTFLMGTLVDQVFHGADSDILWLQRDFHMYVVNMFDTAKVRPS